MKSILYITTVPFEYGGKEDGGIANHSIQLITKAKESYKVGLYTNIRQLKKIQGINLHQEANKLFKIIKGIIGLLVVDKEKLKNINFLGFKDKLKVLYHFQNLRKITSEYDIVHVHSLHHDAITALSLMKNRPRLIATDHGFWQGNIEQKLMKVKYNSFNSDKVIYISDYAKTKHEEYGLDTRNLIKIYNPFMAKKNLINDKEEVMKSLNIDNNSPVIFFSGVSDPVNRKGLDILLNSISSDKYLRENVCLIIVANDEGLRFAEKYNTIEKIIMLKPMPYKKVMELYSITDVFILPSRSESFGLVYIEALSYGTPVIGFDKVVSEFQNLYSPLFIGDTFNPSVENVSDLAIKIKAVLSSDVDRINLRTKTNSLFSWDRLFIQFSSVYEDIKD
ncbi:glycosyltransferase family 4 protein [Planococcus sp. CAU13]|uniref:glycosyltransferase family 4 protein n=1 Tax=Planococcus sp. CAU13 TaxID=1541197 RepID=UPI00052FFC9D|nr:glycosyltransferase family 4 protein [Planococcus sp. CAU13]